MNREVAMNDVEKLQLLLRRLDELEHRIVPDWQKPILAVGRTALEAEITEIGRRMRRLDYLRPSRSRASA